MQCISCGTIIPPGAKHCPSCGTPVYDPGVYQETAHSSPIHPTEPENPAASYNPGTFQEATSSQINPSSDRTIPANNFQSGGHSTPPPDLYPQSPYSSTQQQQQLYSPGQPPLPSYEPTQPPPPPQTPLSAGGDWRRLQSGDRAWHHIRHQG